MLITTTFYLCTYAMIDKTRKLLLKFRRHFISIPLASCFLSYSTGAYMFELKRWLETKRWSSSPL